MELYETVKEAYLSLGVLGLMVVGFFILVIWVLKTSKEREERITKTSEERETKLYEVVQGLTSQLPEMRESLKYILEEVKRR